MALAFGGWLLPWQDWVPPLRLWVDDHAMTGWLAFIGVYIVVVMLPLPAAAMSIFGGLAFGWWGFPLSMVGSILGAVFPYLIGRRLLRAPLLRRFDGPKVAAADRAIAQNAVLFIILLRLTPILPFTVQNWLLGVTSVRFWPYVWASTVGLAPGTLAMVWIGEMGGLASAEVQGLRFWGIGAGLAIFGALIIWMGRVATQELRRAGVVEDSPGGPSSID
ncbi:TVP38/TMEM64 family protein [Jannaschia sp. AI_61]|uniref:TVP38/TMEM64 family protein n=1 Tax=Jannaschia sp. AI_61 TaxID=2829796 RepID=UPI001C7DBC92|nr:VTT domain-containing protein [Jannaschia sp. AI_61]